MNPRGTTPSPAEKAEERLSGGSEGKSSIKGGIRVLRKRNKVTEWMGAGLLRKRKQYNEAQSIKYPGFM